RLIRRKIRGMLIDSSGDASWVTDSAVLGYTAAAGRDLDATLKAYLAMANSREPEPLAPHLSQIRCPVRLMVGGARHDGDVGAKEVQLLTRTLPAFVLDSVPAAGHFIQEEEPGAVLAGVARLKASVTAAHATGGVSRVTTGWRLRRRLEEVFRNGRYDIVHVHGGLAPTLGLAAPFAAWRAGIPVVATFHSWFRRSVGCRVFRRPLQRILERHAATIAVSRPVVDANARYFHADWDIIPNGVDTTFFRPN